MSNSGARYSGVPQNATFRSIKHNVERGKKKKLTIGAILVLHIKFAESKIAECNVTSVIKEDVLWLQITVDDIESVKAFKGTEEFSSVETGSVNVKALLLLEMMKQLTAIDESKNQVELLWGLE
jgi:hypothetical protein